MRNTTFARRLCRWLLVAVAGAGAGMAIVPSGVALGGEASPLGQPGIVETPGQEADHLKCWQVTEDRIVDPGPLQLFTPQFEEEETCRLFGFRLRARLFCAPSIKVSQSNPDGNDERGGVLASDFLCYTIECGDSPTRQINIDDQFGKRTIVIAQERLLCTPARKG